MIERLSKCLGRIARGSVAPAALVFLVALTPAARAQIGGGSSAQLPEPEKIVQITAEPITLAAGARGEALVHLRIEPSWHINANPPSPDYMIATQLSVTGARGVDAGAPVYPAARHIKVAFDDSQLAAYDGTVTLRLPLTATARAANGSHTLKGTLRYQSCNDQVCMAPVTIPVAIAVTVTGGAAPGAAATDTASSPVAVGTPEVDTSHAAAGPGFTTGPPPQGTATAAVENPLAQRLESGSWTAFLTLFLIGLALNLTPCVYPMLGVTVSIFGARRAAPPLQVFGLAVVYVLGIALMYSSLGLIAAFTGGLFGGVLANPAVLIGIGLLFIGLSLSMFGLYEIQIPSALLNRLGGNTTTGVLGTFVSGLLVGVFAAPCVGPPVVALLAIVGAKGDPWFGFTSFFTLALGLGAPYLVLGTFSNLLQTLPRSGEWMVWVKKVFGVVMVSLGVFYVLLAVAPSWIAWVPPAALVLGGLYLGFIDRSAGQRAGFVRLKWATGALAILAGVGLVAFAPKAGITFEPYSAASVEQALQGGQPAMLDFTAQWCAPCHELERFTFSDARVRDAARAFRTFRVDLTRYDSPEAEQWRQKYGIRGVPTVLFLSPSGTEVQGARVEGFLPPADFLERMRMAGASGARAERE
jgi:thiol:disulfide interchange protein DsbD